MSDPDGDVVTLSSLPPNYDGNLNALLGGVLTNGHNYEYTYSNAANPNAAGDIVLYKASDGFIRLQGPYKALECFILLYKAL